MSVKYYIENVQGRTLAKTRSTDLFICTICGHEYDGNAQCQHHGYVI